MRIFGGLDEIDILTEFHGM